MPDDDNDNRDGHHALGDAATALVGDAELVREVFDQLPFVVAVLEGPEHRLVAVNAAYRALAGRDDLLGRPIREVFPEVIAQRIFEMFDQVFTSGEPDQMRAWRMQFQLGDGRLREVFADVDYVPRRDHDGTVLGVTCYITDVTEQVRQRERERAQTQDAERRYLAARDIVADLQEALLPGEVPVLPGVSLAARYLVAARDQSAGGDWFDVVPLPDGTVALVVGDIVGHGVAASATMGQLRAVLDELLTDSGNLSSALERIDRLAARTSAMRAATVCIVVLDPRSGALRYSTCGHPPPLVITPDGAARYLAPSGAGPLGTGSALAVHTDVLHPGEVVILFSDGLVERAGRPIGQGLDTFATIAGDAVANRMFPAGTSGSAAERACQDSVEVLTREGYDDDVTVLAAQRRPIRIPPLHLDLEATPGCLPGIRTEFEGWLDRFEPSPKDRSTVDLAVAELVANVTEHAYSPGRPGTIRIETELEADGILQILVRDAGTWQEPGPTPAPTSGRGLWIVGALVDHLHIDHDRDVDGAGPAHPPGPGTLVVVRHRLHRPAALGAHPGRAQDRSTPRVFVTELDEGPPLVLWVRGSIDITTAGRFADRLSSAGRGGVHSLVVDLTGVDVLTSAGVRALFDVHDQHATHGTALTIVATPASVPAQVLDLVGLSHTPPA